VPWLEGVSGWLGLLLHDEFGPRCHRSNQGGLVFQIPRLEWLEEGQGMYPHGVQKSLGLPELPASPFDELAGGLQNLLSFLTLPPTFFDTLARFLQLGFYGRLCGVAIPISRPIWLLIRRCCSG
jgi:hypothetical protein